MKELLKKYSWLEWVSVILSTFVLLFFISLRECWFGLGHTVGFLGLAYVFIGVMIVTLILEIVFMILKKKGFYNWIFFSLSIFWIIIILVIFMLGGMDYVEYTIKQFLLTLPWVLLVLLFLYLIFLYPTSRIKDMKYVRIGAFSVLTLLILYLVLPFRINSFTHKPVVYVVEDNYQIVFETRTNSKVYVKVGDEYFYDTLAGTDITKTRIHKVVVPQEKLDSAGLYEAYAKAIFFRGAYGTLEGRWINVKSNFYPVDPSDGIKYYSLSDVHGSLNEGVKAASYFGNDLDFLILNGDITSLLLERRDANAANIIAYKVTKGEKPVIYARGNHECKSTYVTDYYRYVGAKDTSFYYWFKLGPIYGIVLDLGEDHIDDWWEFKGTAHFEEYRKEQLEFVKNIDPSLIDSDYRMIISHIPLVHINQRNDFREFKTEITPILNTFNFDVAIYGHQHQFMPFIPKELEAFKKFSVEVGSSKYVFKGELTDFNFLGMMVGKRSDSQEKLAQEFLRTECGGMGAIIDFNNKTETFFWTNSKGKQINIVDPFKEGDLGKVEYVFSLKNVA